ncbi:hypothetical protein CAEBREN_23184 [Caenorhabditis brenneri]|uniref:F-box associated domain-containing protein n=1 Tax=Caenorhabditis brenneri TaxID=135651 RepID=G0MIY4_CAEBE|nr:hypothetical protein CAEBREN_23184 [Caenorhabditis brenneri]
MTINFMRMPLLVQEVVSKHVDWNEFDFTKSVLELMKSRKLKYCLALSKTHFSVDLIKFKLASKNLEIKMKKGYKDLTIRVSSLAIPPERWLYQSNTFWIHRINYIERPGQNHNHLWQPWWPGSQNVLNVKKEEEEMETIRRIMDSLNPVLIFQKTSVTIEESQFVNAFFSWNKIQKFEELTISKGSSRDQTTGEPLAINVTSRILLKILEELEVQNLNLCVQVIDAPDFHYQFSLDKDYKFKKINIEWAGWQDVDSLTNLKIEEMELNIVNGFDQKAILFLNHCKNLEVKMKKGDKELTIRVSSLAIPPERWLYQSNTFWIHQMSYIEKPGQNHNNLWQPWCPGPENVLNVKKEEGEMETIRRIIDYLNPVLIFQKTSVTIEESEFVNAFFSWNKIQKFEELTISKGSSRDQTTGEPLAINVTSGTLLKVLEEFEVQNLNLCVQVIDAPDFHYQFSPDKNYKFKKIDIEWTGWLDVDSLVNLKIEKMKLNIVNGFDQKAIIFLNHWLDGNDETLKEINLSCTGGQNWIRDTIISRPDRSQADVTLDYNSLRMIVRPLPMFPMLLNPIRVPHDGPFGPPVGPLVGPFGGRLVYQQLFRFQ